MNEPLPTWNEVSALMEDYGAACYDVGHAHATNHGAEDPESEGDREEADRKLRRMVNCCSRRRTAADSLNNTSRRLDKRRLVVYIWDSRTADRRRTGR